MDKSLPLSEKAEEKEKEAEGVVRSLHWEPRIRCNPTNNITTCLMKTALVAGA